MYIIKLSFKTIVIKLNLVLCRLELLDEFFQVIDYFMINTEKVKSTTKGSYLYKKIINEILLNEITKQRYIILDIINEMKKDGK